MLKRRKILLGGGLFALAGGGAAYAGIRQMGSMEEYEQALATTRAAMGTTPEVAGIIRYATLAANSHNTQPWRFRIGAAGIDILPDLARRLSVVDPDDHHLYASLGCAAENLRIAASMRGRPGELHDATDSAALSFIYGKGSPAEPAMFDAITKRQSTRSDYDGKAVSPGDLRVLVAASALPGVDVHFVLERAHINRIRDLVIAGNSVQMADAAFMRELQQWMRFSPQQAMVRRDGLFTAASGNPVMPSWLGPFLFKFAFRADAENDKYARQIASSAGLVVFVGHKDDPVHWLRAGRACQRFALASTALGIKHAFLNQPAEVAHLRPALAALVGAPGRRPDLVLRFGYGKTLPFSARRAVSEVIV
jgi:nitroreductase